MIARNQVREELEFVLKAAWEKQNKGNMELMEVFTEEHSLDL